MFDLQYDICLSMEYHRVIPPVYRNSSEQIMMNDWMFGDPIFSQSMPKPFMNICNDKKIIEKHLPGHSFLVRKFLASNRFGPWNYLNTSLL